MLLARLEQALNDRYEERARSARRLHQDQRCEVAVGGVANEIEDQVDDPPTREDLAVIEASVGWCGLRERHRGFEKRELSGGWYPSTEHAFDAMADLPMAESRATRRDRNG